MRGWQFKIAGLGFCLDGGSACGISLVQDKYLDVFKVWKMDVRVWKKNASISGFA
ncbi:MAG: hypothetical protein ACTSXP_04790 [Promethearchaeota archaeon]